MIATAISNSIRVNARRRCHCEPDHRIELSPQRGPGRTPATEKAADFGKTMPPHQGRHRESSDQTNHHLPVVGLVSSSFSRPVSF